MSEAIIRFENVSKFYDDTLILDRVSFEIERGKFYTLLGPSGCGKTTILRLIAGFTEATEGKIYFNEVNTIPGFTAHSRYPGMMKAAGIEFPELIRRLIEMEVGK